MTNTETFLYRGCRFTCSAQPTDRGLFSAQVRYEHGFASVDPCALPQDAEPYATAAEAMRHAQQLAMRWVNDRSGDGQGQF